MHPELWSYLLAPALVEKVTNLTEAQSWSSVKDEIRQLIESSNLGCKLFGWVSKELTGGDMQAIIKKQVAKLLGLPSVGHKQVADILMETMAQMDDVAGIEALPDKREIYVMYRGWKARKVVKSVQEEVELNLVAAARGQAVAKGALRPLPGERELCGAPGTEEKATVKESFVKHSDNARGYLDGLTKTNECKSGEQLMDRPFWWGVRKMFRDARRRFGVTMGPGFTMGNRDKGNDKCFSWMSSKHISKHGPFFSWPGWVQ